MGDLVMIMVPLATTRVSPLSLEGTIDPESHGRRSTECASVTALSGDIVEVCYISEANPLLRCSTKVCSCHMPRPLGPAP